MERVCGRPKFGLYVGGTCLIFLAWLASPGFIAGLPVTLYLIAACGCLLRLLYGPDRMLAAGWLALSVLMVLSEAQWLARWVDVFLVQFIVACLVIVPAMHWMQGTRSLFPPPEYALAVLIIVAESVLLVLFLPGETLFAIARLADTSLGVIFLCWCGSMAAGSRMFVAAITGIEKAPAASAGEGARQQREMLWEAVRTVRADHSHRLHPTAAARDSDEQHLGKAA